MINSLTLKNWRTHADTTLHFGKGTNLIIGIMGSGKSGALNGLCYALFGAFPAARRRESSAMDAISHGRDEAELSVHFVHGGKDYRVVRKLRKKEGRLTVSARLYDGKAVVDSGQDRVTGLVSSILGMDYDLFTRAVYSEQNNIDYFLSVDPGRRKKEMDRLLGLDRFEGARANAVSLLNRLSSEIDAASASFVPEEYESLKRERDGKRKRMALLENEAGESKKELSALKGKIPPLSRKVSAMEEARKKRECARAFMERTGAKIEFMHSELKGRKPSAERLEKLKEEFSALSKRKESIVSSLRSMEKEHASLSSESGKLSSGIEAAVSARDSLSKCTDELGRILMGKTPESLKGLALKKESEVLSISSRMESLASRLSELKEVSSALKPEHSECPLCGSGLTPEGKERIIREKREEAESLKRELLALKESLPGKRKELSLISENIRKAEILEQRIAEMKAGAEKLPALEEMKKKTGRALLELEGKKERESSALGKLEKEYSESLLGCREEESLLKKAESVLAMEGEYKKAKSVFDSIEFDESSLSESRKMLESARIKSEKLNSEIALSEKEHSSLAESVALIERSIVKMEKAKGEGEYLLRLREELTLYRNSLLDLQSELRAEMTSSISAAMDSIWQVVYPYADYRQIRISATEKDYFFEVYDGEWRRLEKVASGGERACLSLALRMALSTVLTPNVGWMMLDEPTHNLDADAVHTLSEALENKVPEIIPQSIVITHEENLISSEFARSYKFSRDKESLGHTVVESL